MDIESLQLPCQHSFENKFLQILLGILTFLVSITFISGCSNGTEEPAIERSGNGELIIGLTDAEGDFVSYTVDVKSITLIKANGKVVHVLPITTRVDFAQYTELTEFLTASMVPLGAYKHVSMVLDYTNADIRVENADAEIVQAMDIQDVNGAPVTELEMTVHLEGRNKLVISRGVPAYLTLDFDLNATNKTVFDDAGNPTVFIEPYLVADAYLQKPKVHRVRGPLNSVDVVSNQFEIIITPFHHKRVEHYDFGNLTVTTDDETVFDIDNQSYVGLSGLQAMDVLAQFTQTIVIGKFAFGPTRFVAREVYAGESVPGGTMDVVKGNILARNGNVLTVKGATLIRSGGTVSFNDLVTVNISDVTMVKKQLSTESHSIDEISVGQKVSVFGTITNNETNTMEMDASNGVVRMKITKVYGASVELSINPLMSDYFVMDAKRFNGKPADLFDFTGTGTDAANDADPSLYEVNTGMLPVDEIEATTPVKVFGFVTPFGSAPADFMAISVVDLTRVPATITMNWTPDTGQPFIEVMENSVVLNMNGRGVFHHVGRGGAIVDLSSITPAPTIRAVDSDGQYELKGKGPWRMFSNFAEYIAEIETQIANGSSMKRIVAHGYYNDITATLTADTIYTKLK